MADEKEQGKTREYKTQLPNGEEIKIGVYYENNKPQVYSTGFWVDTRNEEYQDGFVNMAIKAVKNEDKAREFDVKTNERHKINKEANNRRSEHSDKRKREIEQMMSNMYIEGGIKNHTLKEIVRDFEVSKGHLIGSDETINYALNRSFRWLTDRAKQAKNLS